MLSAKQGNYWFHFSHDSYLHEIQRRQQKQAQVSNQIIYLPESSV